MTSTAIKMLKLAYAEVIQLSNDLVFCKNSDNGPGTLLSLSGGGNGDIPVTDARLRDNFVIITIPQSWTNSHIPSTDTLHLNSTFICNSDTLATKGLELIIKDKRLRYCLPYNFTLNDEVTDKGLAIVLSNSNSDLMGVIDTNLQPIIPFMYRTISVLDWGTEQAVFEAYFGYDSKTTQITDQVKLSGRSIRLRYDYVQKKVISNPSLELSETRFISVVAESKSNSLKPSLALVLKNSNGVPISNEYKVMTKCKKQYKNKDTLIVLSALVNNERPGYLDLDGKVLVPDGLFHSFEIIGTSDLAIVTTVLSTKEVYTGIWSIAHQALIQSQRSGIVYKLEAEGELVAVTVEHNNQKFILGNDGLLYTNLTQAFKIYHNNDKKQYIIESYGAMRRYSSKLHYLSKATQSDLTADWLPVTT